MARILVVDDQFGLRRLLFEVFREDQHEVQMAENGAEALRLFISFEPDLILMDMKMPGMNGIETLIQIRALNCRASVIMMTAYGDPKNMEKAKNLGILCYITKPFDLFELRELVSKVLNNSGSLHKSKSLGVMTK
ncbi:response regulator [Desulfosporosinus sp. Sb-LF]|uniref:response regulator n=1 Tax=Desulfosporosinus sp. Sb-LF TaxID=2560027 RepID=UPI00107FB325|nr:response regulator [Desulfosporosinus sp. Sb-LF]TGE32350.1 response regulator [Desulfosporosinus sp. Sb-LF]